MLDFLKSRWFLFLVLVVFVALKIPCLHYAYFWDESWPYAVAVKAMYNHGISLMPNAIDAEISRGHPLLFHALAAGWMHLFGSSHTAVHCFPLVISVLMLISIYEAGLKLFNQRVAMMALLMAAIQVTFYVQATFLLFEVMVALLVFVSLYFYARDKYVLTALCLTALFHTKESGLIAGFVLGMDALIGLFKKGVVRRVAVSRFLSVAVPCVLIVGYFIVQRYVRGWFLFPFYGNLIVNKWSLFIYNFRAGPISAEFLKDKRYFYFIIVMAVAVIAGVKNKKPGYLLIFVPAIFIYYHADPDAWGPISEPWFFALLPLSVLFLLYVLNRIGLYRDSQQKRFITLSIIFIFCFLCFSAMNFFLTRYLLASIFPYLFLCAVLLDFFLQRSYRVLFYIVLPGLLATGLYAFHINKGFGDTDPYAFDAVDAQQHLVDWLEKNNYYDKTIGTGAYIEHEHLSDPTTGFLSTDKNFKRVRWDIDDSTDLAVFDNLEVDYRYKDFAKNPDFGVVYRYQKGDVWVEVWGRKR